MCDGARVDGTCWYTDSDFSVLPIIHMGRQFDYKYLPDIDGNSFSGRYRAFVMSTSVPIKATIYREWHDSRLVAWKHFVPMDNRFGDFYGIMEYFLGFEGAEGGKAVPGHDAAAEKIALTGKEWAERVLRKEDMQVYVLRLLLEYARICDDNRDMLGFVGDLNGMDWHGEH
jgi:Glycosyl transferase family 90